MIKEYLPLVAVMLIALNGTGTAALADDGKLVSGAKKVGGAVIWPFKKLGHGLKALGKKVAGK